jgi:hypothetical protein
MKTSEIRRLVNAKIKAELAKLGFQKKKWHYLCDINEETIGRILFNHTSYTGQGFAEAPIVGVKNTRIQKIILELLQDIGDYSAKKEGWPAAAFSANIGYFMPINKWTRWHFIEGVDVDEVIRDMIGSIKEYGMPAMKRMSDRESLLKEIKVRRFLNPDPGLITPALYLLLGRKADAIEHTQKVIEAYKNWVPDHSVDDQMEERWRRQGYTVISERPEPESPEEIARIREDRLKYYEPIAKRVAEYPV